MKPGVLLLVAITALVAATTAPAARVAQPRAQSPGLLELGGYEHALVQLERGAAQPKGAALVSRRLSVWRLRTVDAMRVLPKLLAERRVKVVEPDRPLDLFASQDEFSEFEWWRPNVGADRATPPGPGKPLTVIDSGLDVTHPEFAGRPNTSLLNAQRFDESDREYHGTAVSSVAAAPTNGVGIVGVYPQAVLRMWDAGAPILSRLIEGIEAAINAGAGVINISLGFSGYDPLLEEIVLQAFRTGSIVVAAAGNDREQGSPETFPANLNHVLTVAATDEADRPTGFSNASLGVDLAAPGQNIPGAIAFDGWEFLDGTSFSAPLVAGATAWVWTVRPDLDKTQIFDLMRWTARDVAAEGFDSDTGFGVLDIPSALSAQAPPVDAGSEPNDDISHVKANGLFRQATPPLTTPSRGGATINARLDATEDPEDVYRVWVPAGRVVRVAVTPTADVDVDVWKATTPSVLVRGNVRRRHLLATSTKAGRAVERVTVRNRTKRGFFVYLDAYLKRDGPLDADYRVAISTARR